MRGIVLLVALGVGTLAACEPTAPPGTTHPAVPPTIAVHASANTGSAFAVPRTGTYAYRLSVDCVQLGGPLKPRAFAPALQFDGPGNFIEPETMLAGEIWLTAGRWIGTPGYWFYVPPEQHSCYRFEPKPCSWSMMLTPALGRSHPQSSGALSSERSGDCRRLAAGPKRLL